MHANLRTGAVLLAVGGLGLGLVGVGARAAMTDSGSVNESVKVGKLECKVTSTDPAAVISPDGHTVTVNLPDILSSASGNAYSNFTVVNTGTMPELVHWSVTTGGTIAFQPAGRMGYTVGPNGNLVTTDLTLAAGASHSYDNMGFQWATLQQADLGQTASVTYTANCGEVPPPPVSHIQFIGLASEAGHAALTLPAGAQAGDMILVLEAGTAAVATPTGYTNIATPVAPRNNLSYKVMVAGDNSVPAPAATVTDIEVAVYRGVSGIGSHTYFSANSNGVGVSGGSPLYYPLKSIALDGVSGPAMTKTDGSSWVVNMGYDAYASTNMNLLSFNKVISSSPTPYVMDGPLAGNRAQPVDVHVGLADTGAGVAAYPGGAWSSPGDNFPLPGSHGVADHVIELLSA